MGRYYRTESGHCGKFLVALQNSDDPGTLGMVEQDQQTINYYADDNHLDDITDALDKEYDVLHVDEKDRKYDIPQKNREIEGVKAFTLDTDDFNKRLYAYTDMLKDKYLQPSEDKLTEDRQYLALGRIELALRIISDIKQEGYCALEADIY